MNASFRGVLSTEADDHWRYRSSNRYPKGTLKGAAGHAGNVDDARQRLLHDPAALR